MQEGWQKGIMTKELKGKVGTLELGQEVYFRLATKSKSPSRLKYIYKSLDGSVIIRHKTLLATAKPVEKFNLEIHFQGYLDRVGLSRQAMSRVQYIETKRAFMAGVGQMLLLNHEVADCDEEKAIYVLDDLTNQVQAFFKEEVSTKEN